MPDAISFQSDPAVCAALTRAAQDARDAGHLEQAAEAWRALLRRWPEHWRAALELKRDMAAMGHYSESDFLFRRAARHLPDNEWLAHNITLYAFHYADLAALDARAREILARRPDDVALHILLGDIARQCRDFAAAKTWFAGAAALAPDKAEYGAKLRAARRYHHLSRWLTEQPAEGDEYAVAFVNLDRNTERRAEVEGQFRDSPVPLHRVPAVEGRRLPLSAVGHLTRGKADAGLRGTLGCFLSHAAPENSSQSRCRPITAPTGTPIHDGSALTQQSCYGLPLRAGSRDAAIRVPSLLGFLATYRDCPK